MNGVPVPFGVVFELIGALGVAAMGLLAAAMCVEWFLERLRRKPEVAPYRVVSRPSPRIPTAPPPMPPFRYFEPARPADVEPTAADGDLVIAEAIRATRESATH